MCCEARLRVWGRWDGDEGEAEIGTEIGFGSIVNMDCGCWRFSLLEMFEVFQSVLLYQCYPVFTTTALEHPMAYCLRGIICTYTLPRRVCHLQALLLPSTLLLQYLHTLPQQVHQPLLYTPSRRRSSMLPCAPAKRKYQSPSPMSIQNDQCIEW